MATLTDDPRRPDRKILDYLDIFGKRHRRSFPKTPEGLRRAAMELAIVKAQTRRETAIDADITMYELAKHFIAIKTAQAREGRCAAGTVRMYETTLSLHVCNPDAGKHDADLGRYKVRAVSRQMVEKLLAVKGKLYSHAHVGNMLAATSALLTCAQDEGIIDVNPLFRMGKAVKGTDWTREVNTQAMEREQRDLFLDTALVHEPRWFAALATLTYAGLRMGEARGLQRHDIRRVEIRVERQVYAVENKIHPGVMIGPPKGSTPGKIKRRSVDMADQLVPILHPLVTRPGDSPWLFFDEEPTVVLARAFTWGLGAAMQRVLEAAGPEMPKHFTPHDLRHTFACMVITQDKVRTGDLLLYLSQQLGHDKTAVTETTYARWLQQRNRAAATAGASRAETSAADQPLSSVILPFRK